MTTATKRISFLVTAKEKAQLAKLAANARLSVGEFVRRAALSHELNDNSDLLAAAVDDLDRSTRRANMALDDALSFVRESNARIAAMEARMERKRTDCA